MICGSVLRWPAAATRWQGWGRCWRPDPEGLRDEVGVLAHAVARALDLHNDGVVQQSVQQGGGDHRVRENLAPFGKAAIGRESIQNRGVLMGVGLGSGLTGRGWAGAETGVAGEAGCRAATWGDDGDRGSSYRAR